MSSDAPADGAPRLPWTRRLARKARKTWASILREQATPSRLGAALGFGVFVGCTPLWGLQTVIALVAAHLFRLNKVAVFGGLQVSGPPLAPLTVYASVQLGYRLLQGAWVPMSLSAMGDLTAGEIAARFFWAFALGGTLLGVVLGLLVWPATAWLVARARAGVKMARLPHEELDLLFDRLDHLPDKYRHYAAWKLRLDPLYATVLPLFEGRREVLDLGAGIGLFGAALCQRNPSAQVRGVEWDAEKARVAQVLLQGLPARVEAGDARVADLGHPDAIALFDMLHYAPVEEQRAFLLRVAAALGPGGRLVLRELDPEARQGSWAERLERWAVARGWNRGAGVYPWPLSQMRALLEEQGFEVQVQPEAARGLFRANALLVATRRG